MISLSFEVSIILPINYSEEKKHIQCNQIEISYLLFLAMVLCGLTKYITSHGTKKLKSQLYATSVMNLDL